MRRGEVRKKDTIISTTTVATVHASRQAIRSQNVAVADNVVGEDCLASIGTILHNM